MIVEKYFKDKLSSSIFDTVKQASESLGLESFVIGGFVRDLILGRPSKDIDIVTIGKGIELATEVTNRLGKRAHLSVFQNFGTAQVKFSVTRLQAKASNDLAHGTYEIEFVGARKESYQRDSRKPIVEDGTFEDDIHRRDFTINTLALSLNESNFGQLIDHFDGLSDLNNKIIKTPLDPDITFSDDPLRMMRGIRFATQLDFRIEDATLDAIARNAHRIEIISQERIIDELNKIILSKRPSLGFLLLDKTGLLEIIFPEFVLLKGAQTKDGVGHKDNFYHTLRVLDNIAEHTDNLWLRWSAILHDIAKPATKKWIDKYGWTFHNHNFIGEKLVPKIFKRLKLPTNESMKYVQKMVLLHMRPQVLVDEDITDAAVRRLLFEAGNDIEDLMTLCEADITSKNEYKVRKYLNNFKIVRQKLKEIEEKDHVRNFQPPIDGQEIMDMFGLPPSAIVGELKAVIKDAILDGVIPNDYDAAYNLLLDHAKNNDLTLLKKK